MLVDTAINKFAILDLDEKFFCENALAHDLQVPGKVEAVIKSLTNIFALEISSPSFLAGICLNDIGGNQNWKKYFSSSGDTSKEICEKILGLEFSEYRWRNL